MKNRKNRRTRQVFAGILAAALLFSTAFGQAAMAEGDPVQSEPITEPTTEPSTEPVTEPTTEPNTSVMDVQNLINALPTAGTLAAMSTEEQQAAREKLDSVQRAYMALSDEQKGQVIGTEIFDRLYEFFNKAKDEAPADDMVIQETQTSEAETGGAACTCETACTVDMVNTDCPICSEDVSRCTGTQPTANTVLLDEEPDMAVEDVQNLIDALPTAEELKAMPLEEQQAVYTQLYEAYDAYEVLSDEQKAQISGAEIFDALFAVFNGMTETLDDPAVAPGGTINAGADVSTIQTVFGGADNVTVSGSTITLNKDVTVSSMVIFRGATWTLDLGGYTLSGQDVAFNDCESVTVQNQCHLV